MLEMNRNKNKRRSILAVITITVLVLAYLAFYYGLLIRFFNNPLVRIVLSIIGLAFAIAMIVVCRQRLKEIKGGETDDLSKY